MKAIIYHQHGSPDVLRLEESPVPVPGADEVLVRVHAAALNPLDLHLMHGVGRLPLPRALRGGRPGADVAGVVESVGQGVTSFNPGDAVFGTCRGACAEFVATRESRLARKPAGVSFENAAAIPIGGLTALQGLRDAARVQPGHLILIHGASGGVGTFAVQIASWLGGKVTAVCSGRNAGLVRSLGAGTVIDYQQNDFTRGASKFDVIYDLVADHSLLDCRRVLNRNGVYVGAGILGMRTSMARILARFAAGAILSLATRRKSSMFMARAGRPADLDTLAALVSAGTITPVIDSAWPLEQTAAAMRHLEQKHARGKVIITVP